MKHTLSSLWQAFKEAAVSDSPAEAIKDIGDEIFAEAKKEVEEEKRKGTVLAEGEEKPQLNGDGKA